MLSVTFIDGLSYYDISHDIATYRHVDHLEDEHHWPPLGS